MAKKRPPGRPSALDEKLQRALLERRSETGASPKQLFEWLKKERKFKGSYLAVWRFLQKHDEERAQAVKSTVTDVVATHIIRDMDRVERDLQRLDRDIEEFDRMAESYRRLLLQEDGSPGPDHLARIGARPIVQVWSDLKDGKRALIAEIREHIAMKFKYAGADQAGGETAEQKREEARLRAEKLRAEIAVLKMKGGTEDDSPVTIQVMLPPLVAVAPATDGEAAGTQDG